ncbi:peptidase S10 serine carboxypeptidase [Serendipita vermifera]|nr:peptidase S10 serine carboxypeptidase [Serendipita vermifera]
MAFRGLIYAALLLPNVLGTLVNPLILQPPAPQAVEWDPLPKQPSQIELSSLSSTEFSTLTHPLYPEHQVRIKETKGFCDPTVKAYTGFIDIEHGRKHLFFYFFESRRNPDEDDVVMWINGGPGGSSALGLFAELGPCWIDPRSSNGTSWNEWGWNRESNLIFLDQPIDVGYSYGDKVPIPSTAPQAARDVHAFLTIWFETFTKFKGRGFHFAGESYGGRYIPVYASHIWDRNQVAASEGRTPINLQSVMIGNGWTNPGLLYGSYYDMLCKNSTITPFYTIQACSELVHTAAECEKKVKDNCGRNYNPYDCRAAFRYCEAELQEPFGLTGRNWYDISKSCADNGDPGMDCYPQVGQIIDYLSKNKTKDMLGVPRDHRFEVISFRVNAAFVLAGDMFENSEAYLVGLLERGVRVLVYVGTNDLACNFVGNYRTVQGFDWTGAKEFVKKELREWKVKGHVAGETKSEGRLTFATVRGAGHLVPFDKSAEAAYLLEHWISGRPL